MAWKFEVSNTSSSSGTDRHTDAHKVVRISPMNSFFKAEGRANKSILTFKFNVKNLEQISVLQLAIPLASWQSWKQWEHCGNIVLIRVGLQWNQDHITDHPSFQILLLLMQPDLLNGNWEWSNAITTFSQILWALGCLYEEPICTDFLARPSALKKLSSGLMRTTSCLVCSSRRCTRDLQFSGYLKVHS